jgi:hypothetical protein
MATNSGPRKQIFVCGDNESRRFAHQNAEHIRKTHRAQNSRSPAKAGLLHVILQLPSFSPPNTSSSYPKHVVQLPPKHVISTGGGALAAVVERPPYFLLPFSIALYAASMAVTGFSFLLPSPSPVVSVPAHGQAHRSNRNRTAARVARAGGF